MLKIKLVKKLKETSTMASGSISFGVTKPLFKKQKKILEEVKLDQVFSRLSSNPFQNWLKSVSISAETQEALLQDIQKQVMKWIEFMKPYIQNTEKEAALGIDWFLTSLIAKKTEYEDLYKVFDRDEEGGYLGKFIKLKKLLLKKDLRQYNSPAELFSALKQFKSEQALKVDPTNIKDLVKVAEDQRGAIYIPKTKQASCEAGKGTEWCTAKYSEDDERNMFDSYGQLYIYFDKKLLKRFQASFLYSSAEMMTEDDEKIIHIPFVNLLCKDVLQLTNLYVTPEYFIKTLIEDHLNIGGYLFILKVHFIYILKNNIFGKLIQKYDINEEIIDDVVFTRLYSEQRKNLSNKLFEYVFDDSSEDEKLKTREQIKHILKILLKEIYNIIEDAYRKTREASFGNPFSEGKLMRESVNDVVDEIIDGYANYVSPLILR